MEQQVQKQNMKKPISDLSNMVFGVALSIGALTLINNISTVTTPSVIFNSIITFAFSFVIIIYMWFRYTKALELMKVESRIEVDLNILILFLVAVEPYLLYLLETGSNQLADLTSTLYALDISGLLLVLFVFYRIGITANKDLGKDVSDYYKPISYGLLISGVIYGISALPLFWNIPIFGLNLRFAMWVAALIISNSLRRKKSMFRK